MILDVVSVCRDYGLVNIFMLIKKFFNILQILVPIIALVFLGVNVVKSVINPEDKKNFSRYKNWIIALVMVFALPTIVNAVMGILGENYSISSCWNNAEEIYKAGKSTYNDGIDGDKKDILGDNKYED